jgi:hypothetical protein
LESHSGKNMVKCFLNILQNYNISTKVIFYFIYLILFYLINLITYYYL